MVRLRLCVAAALVATVAPECLCAPSFAQTSPTADAPGYLAAYRQGRLDEACELIERERANQPGAQRPLAALLNDVIVLATACGRPELAGSAGRDALAIAGLAESDRLIIQGNLALASLRADHPAQARAEFQRIADRQAALGLDSAAAITRINLAIAQWQSDELDTARATLSSALEGIPKDSPARLPGLLNLVALSTMTLHPGDAFRAATDASAIAPGGDGALTLRAALAIARAKGFGDTWQDAAASYSDTRKAVRAILEATSGAHGVFDYIPLLPSGAGLSQGVALQNGPELKSFVDEARQQAFNADAARGAKAFDMLLSLEERLGATVTLGLDLRSAAAKRAKLGDAAGSLSLAQRAGALTLQQFDVDPIVNRDDLNALAAQLQSSGKAAEAKSLRDRIARAPAILAKAKAIEGRYYGDRRGPAENLALVEQALAILTGYPGPRSHFYANQLDMKAVFLLEAGRADEAIPVVQQAIEINREALGARSADVVRELVLLADLLRFAGRKDEARAQLAMLVRIAGEADANAADAVESYIAALTDSGRGREALSWATRQIDDVDRQKRLSASKLAHNAELAAQGQVGDVVVIAGDSYELLVQRARVQMALGRAREAASDARAALAIIGKLQDPMIASWDYPTAQILLGQASLALGDAATAKAQAEAATATLAKFKGVDPIVANAAAVLLTRARLAEPTSAASALGTLQPLVAAAESNPIADALPLPGRLEAATGAISRADLFALSLDARWAAAGSSHDPALALAAAQQALATPASQAVALAAGRRLASSGKAGLGELAREREELVGRYAAADKRYAEASTGADADAQAQRQAAETEKQSIAARFAAIDTALRKDAPSYFALVRQEPLTLAAAQAALGPDEAVLMVAPGEFGTHLLAITKSGLTWQRSSWSRDRVTQAVRRLLWFSGADVKATNVEVATWTSEVEGGENGFDRATAFALYQQIVGPLELALAGHKRLFVIGGGPLSSLPFAMLVGAPPEGGDSDPAALRATKWFGDAYALTQLPSLQSLALLRDGHARPTSAPASFVGFGDPVLDPPDPIVAEAGDRGAGRGRGRLRGGAPLPADLISYPAGSTIPLADPAELRSLKRLSGTALEVTAMAKVLAVPQDRIYLGEADREATFRSSPSLRDATIISLATHGLLGGSLSTVAEPGLVFTPPASPSPADDGYLTTSEVATLSLRSDWVILSACNTAAGDGTAGAPGLSGLARAFFHAGARNLLVSNWPVRDDVAPSLTVGAVERSLKNPELSRAEALQAAVKAVRDNPTADKQVIKGINQTWAHPSAWAPFSLVGDGR